MKIDLRPEQPGDHRAVEELTRHAFWNLYVPGAVEHLLAHKLRKSPDLIPELDYVALSEGRIVGSILYSRSAIVGGDGRRTKTLTFGPVSVEPSLQGKGIGSALIQHTLFLARRLPFPAVIILGDPDYYQRFGFRPARDYGIWYGDGVYPVAHQVLELVPGRLDGVSGQFQDSAAFSFEPQELTDFDSGFPPLKKEETASQRWFATLSTTYFETE